MTSGRMPAELPAELTHLLGQAKELSENMDELATQMASMMETIERCKVDLKAGRVGRFAIAHFSVSEHASFMTMLRGAMRGRGYVPPGDYTKLLEYKPGSNDHDGTMWMSDTPDEIMDHMEMIQTAAHYGGTVLINGLGIGMCAAACCQMKRVEKVIVVELEAEIIELVGSQLKERYGDKIEIVHASAFDYEPTQEIDVVWHDIWPTICGDWVAEMDLLMNKYDSIAGWQGCWCYEQMDYMNNLELRLRDE